MLTKTYPSALFIIYLNSNQSEVCVCVRRLWNIFNNSFGCPIYQDLGWYMEFNKREVGLNSAAEQNEKLRVALIIKDRLRDVCREKNRTASFRRKVSCKKKNHFKRRLNCIF